MMERLTKRTDNGDAWYNHRPDKTVYNSELLQRLAYYEDMEEQGRLKIFPCGVGDTVYEVKRMTDKKAKAAGAPVNPWGKVWWGDRPFEVKEKQATKTDLTRIGKTVFLTREEAEQALEGKHETST